MTNSYAFLFNFNQKGLTIELIVRLKCRFISVAHNHNCEEGGTAGSVAIGHSHITTSALLNDSVNTLFIGYDCSFETRLLLTLRSIQGHFAFEW